MYLNIDVVNFLFIFGLSSCAELIPLVVHICGVIVSSYAIHLICCILLLCPSTGHNLGCWCVDYTTTDYSPSATVCHGQVLMKIIAEVEAKQQETDSLRKE